MGASKVKHQMGASLGGDGEDMVEAVATFKGAMRSDGNYQDDEEDLDVFMRGGYGMCLKWHQEVHDGSKGCMDRMQMGGSELDASFCGKRKRFHCLNMFEET
ncbi:putative receptor protein kinase TMK1 [Sesbania bispinosa]|nr:putative receptor protein kinase TMK1 [Sesbania bispinosa]